MEALAAFVAAAGIEYTMLSDVDSRVIRQYGVLNTLVGPEDDGEPVPEGMVATRIQVEGPEGIRFEPIERPPTRPLELPGLDATLNGWEGTVDFVIPGAAHRQADGQ